MKLSMLQRAQRLTNPWRFIDALLEWRALFLTNRFENEGG